MIRIFYMIIERFFEISFPFMYITVYLLWVSIKNKVKMQVHMILMSYWNSNLKPFFLQQMSNICQCV